MFKNIDEFTREAYGQESTKAPAHVKENLTKVIGTGIGLGTWILGGLGLTGVAVASFLLINSSNIEEAYGKTDVSIFSAAYNDNIASSGIKTNYTDLTNSQLTNQTNENADISVIPETTLNQNPSATINPSNSQKVSNSNSNLVHTSSNLNYTKTEIIPRGGNTNGANELATPKVEIISPNRYNENDLENQEAEETSVNDKNIYVFGISQDPKVEIPELPEYPNYWYITAESGLNMHNAFYSNPAFGDADMYETGTKQLLSSETNIDLTYRTKSFLTLSAGLGYSEFNENFNYTSASNALVEYDYSGKNKLSYATLRIGLGTQIDINKLKLDIFAQGRFNSLLRSNGAYIEDNSLVEYTRNDDIFKKSFLNLSLGMRAHYPITKNIYGTAVVQYTPVFGEMTNDAPFRRKMQYTHAGLGLSYFF
ncbi:MAG: hypothetical protein MK078_07455 [Crocinitomicaceae bacterium]|nr:hypothetical protein [Crocinitomicaceae bacterium]